MERIPELIFQLPNIKPEAMKCSSVRKLPGEEGGRSMRSQLLTVIALIYHLSPHGTHLLQLLTLQYLTASYFPLFKI